MKKFILSMVLASTVFCNAVKAEMKSINISNLNVLQGTIVSSDNEYMYIDTIDGNGWVIYLDNDFLVGDNIYVIFDNMDTDNIYDDEIIKIIKMN